MEQDKAVQVFRSARQMRSQLQQMGQTRQELRSAIESARRWRTHSASLRQRHLEITCGTGQYAGNGIGNVRQDPEKPSPTASYRLTRRERQILNLVAQGKRNKEIAAELELSLFTVYAHMRHLLEKLKCSSRTEASVKAIREGLLPESAATAGS